MSRTTHHRSHDLSAGRARGTRRPGAQPLALRARSAAGRVVSHRRARGPAPRAFTAAELEKAAQLYATGASSNKNARDDFFLTWTPDSAWVLGLLFGDGHVKPRGTAVKLRVSSTRSFAALVYADSARIRCYRKYRAAAPPLGGV